MRPSKRLERIPPYLFAQLERKVAEKRAQGVDVISLGIGDPDTPTPRVVVDALREAAGDPGTHQYPSNRGRQEFRDAVAATSASGDVCGQSQFQSQLEERERRNRLSAGCGYQQFVYQLRDRLSKSERRQCA